MALSSQTQRTLLLSFIASISACGLVGIYTLLLGTFSWLEARILGTTAAVGGASILAMAAAVAWESRRWHPIGPIGMLMPAAALVAMLALIWDLTPNTTLDLFERAAGSLCVLAVAFPHLALLSLARLHRGYEWVRIATVIVIALLTALILTMIWAERFDGDVPWRLIGTLAILNACGTVAVPILHRISTAREQAQTLVTDQTISVTCPRCSKTQMLPMGRSTCACGLRIRVEVEEEHCPKCGYALYKLTSGVCPECGTSILAGR